MLSFENHGGLRGKKNSERGKASLTFTSINFASIQSDRLEKSALGGRFSLDPSGKTTRNACGKIWKSTSLKL